MYIVLEKILTYIFPLSDEALIVQNLKASDIHELFHHTYVQNIHVLSSYTDLRMRALIHEAKFHHNTSAYIMLGNLVTQYLKIHSSGVDIILPLPLSKIRLRTRGYNQVHEVLKRVSLPNNTIIRTDILVRQKNTRPQTDLTRKERLVNVHNAFGIVHTESIMNKHVVIIDDVMTTGATLSEARAVLLPHSPASVTCIALAH